MIDNDKIKEVFPSYVPFTECIVKPTFNNGDIVRLKPEYSVENMKCSRYAVWNRDGHLSKNTTWIASKVWVKIDENGNQTTYFGWLHENAQYPILTGWVEDAIADQFELVERTNPIEEIKCYLPFHIGDTLWKFHTYFSPDKVVLSYYAYCLGNITKSICMKFKEWHYVSHYKGTEGWELTQSGWGPYLPYTTHYYDDYRRDENGNLIPKSYEPIYYSKDMVKEYFSNENNFIALAKLYKEHKKFGDNEIAPYKWIMEAIDRPMEDLEKAMNKSVVAKSSTKKSLVKKATTKKKTTAKTKVADMFKGMSEKEKKEMLKLLQGK